MFGTGISAPPSKKGTLPDPPMKKGTLLAPPLKKGTLSDPPFEKGGIGGIYKGVMMKNPPKSPFQKGDLKESGLFYKYLPMPKALSLLNLKP